MKRTLIIIPTYNERDNAVRMIAVIKSVAIYYDMDILFVDDTSPDNTANTIRGLGLLVPHIYVLQRPYKMGVGSAHKDGIAWAYDRGYSTVITMDCDFTHPPRYIPDFIRASDGCDVVVGSRHMRKDSVADWDLFRRTLTKLCYFVTRHYLSVPYDATGAYRLYRLDRIPESVFDLVKSKGYSFFVESLFMLHKNGFKIGQVAIDLPARTLGSSKMTLKDGWESVKNIISLRFR